MNDGQRYTVVYFDGERRTVRAAGREEAKQKAKALRPEVWILQVFPVAVRFPLAD